MSISEKNKTQSQNQNQRKGLMNTGHQNHNENHNPKSVSHANGPDKFEENSRVRDQRNKSVFNKVDLTTAVQKPGFAHLKKMIKEPST